MTSVNNGTSGGVGAGRKKEKKRGRPSKKSVSDATVSNENDIEMTCFKCTEVFVEESDKLLECERCENWYCIKCAGLDDSVYTVMVANKNLHWFCVEWEKPALSAVRSDKDIEERCAAYMSTLTGRIGDIEVKVDGKVDKIEHEKLSDRVKILEEKTTSEPASASDISDQVREITQEQKEREYRARALIIQNLPESDKEQSEGRSNDDLESVGDLMKEIGIAEEDVIENCFRIGKFEADKKRIVKVTVSSVDMKKKILKNSRKLKGKKNYENIYIGPDLTRMQRAEQFKLRSELRNRKEQGETDIFINGGKIVSAKDRAVQFRGGAEASGAGEK